MPVWTSCVHENLFHALGGRAGALIVTTVSNAYGGGDEWSLPWTRKLNENQIREVVACNVRLAAGDLDNTSLGTVSGHIRKAIGCDWIRRRAGFSVDLASADVFESWGS